MSALTPKPLSEVLRHHAALCVKPIFWIPPLLDILGCRFQQVEDETANPIDDEPAEPAKPAKRAKRRLMSDEEVAQLTPCKLAVLNLAAPGIHVAKHGGINNLFYYDEQGRFEECG
ncbi:hypothetical protein OCS_06720 [Ophiocordyceps sinensis CO18]|nr:hypothetical protein OCS_06720 [Ophiocordyceps sinensis CO18]